MQSRRILITGLSTFWGGRLAQRLERDPGVETVIGVDTADPTRELERTEFVRVSNQHALIRRIVAAAEIDTVIDTRLTVDSSVAPPRVAHENNVIGTMNILAACSGPDSSVRKVVFKSSAHWYGCEQDDPAFFTEDMDRPHPPRTPIEKDIVEAENAVEDFRSKNPDTSVCVLRFVNSLGPDLTTSHTRLFSALPAVPAILGFDPRYQFIHEDDIVGALEHASRNDIDGIYNAGGDGVLVLSEVASLLGKPLAPVLPPWGTGIVASQIRRLGMRIPTELLNQLRFGRGIDNRLLKSTGYDYRYTTREAVQKFAEHLRIKPLVSRSREPYRYEQEVEEFLRWSPSVRVSNERAGKRWQPSERELGEIERAIAVVRASEDDGVEGASQVNRPPGAQQAAAPAPAPDPPPSRPAAGRREPGYGALTSAEVIDLLPSLEPRDIARLRQVEASHQGREEVLAAIDRILLKSEAPDPGA
jgi:UDP-glucose 4-epimerase